jgi:hypothetical protein
MLQMAPVDMQAYSKAKEEGQEFDFVGNLIYAAISPRYGDEMAGKITGMLLEGSDKDFSQYFQAAILSQKAFEASRLLQEQAQ